MVGQTVSLPCVVQGEPIPELAWYRNGLPVGGSTAPLTIQQVGLEDRGVYRCVAKNSAGQETLDTTLDVLGKIYNSATCW